MIDLESITRTLHQLTKDSKDFFRKVEALEAFQFLKARFTCATVLASPSMREIFDLYVDVSRHTMGAVLAQDEIGLKQAICYASKSLRWAKRQILTDKQEI